MKHEPFLIGLFAGLFLISANKAFAQDPGEKKTKVLLFKEHTKSQWDTVSVVKNAVKVNPLLFFHGEIPVYLERAVSERVSLELGLGFTTRNYVSLTISDESDDFGAGTEIQPKLAAHIAARYYLTDDLEPYGWYISPEFATRTYTKVITLKDNEGALTNMTLTDERVFNDLKLLFGYQLLGGASNWLIDFHGGFGLRNRDHQKVREILDLAAGTRTYNLELVDDTILAFFLGFKFGVGF